MSFPVALSSCGSSRLLDLPLPLSRQDMAKQLRPFALLSLTLNSNTGETPQHQAAPRSTSTTLDLPQFDNSGAPFRQNATPETGFLAMPLGRERIYLHTTSKVKKKKQNKTKPVNPGPGTKIPEPRKNRFQCEQRRHVFARINLMKSYFP